MLSVHLFSLIVALLYGFSFLVQPIAAGFSDFQLISSINLKNPAFLDYVTLKGGDTIDLTVTTFSSSEPGQVLLIKNISQAFTDTSFSSASATLDIIADNYVWPNKLTEVPEEVFSKEKRIYLCGGSVDCTIMSLGDGFLVPGHATGSMYLQPIHTSIDAPKLAPVKLAEEETNWYYHAAYWADVDGDGLLDIIAGRAYTNVIGKTDGQLVWLKQPSSIEYIDKPWSLSILQKGPDILLLVDSTSVVGEISVYAPEFWGAKLSLTVIKVGPSPEVVSYSILDSAQGAGYEAFFADTDSDGANELVVNNHEGENGSIFAYELPYDGANELPRITLSSDFVVTKKGMNQASPGLIYPFTIPNNSSSRTVAAITASCGKSMPWWLVAGDGSQGVHIVYPDVNSASVNEQGVSSCTSYITEKIIEIGGTVGSLALVPLDGGSIGVAVPNYDDGHLYFYSFF